MRRCLPLGFVILLTLALPAPGRCLGEAVHDSTTHMFLSKELTKLAEEYKVLADQLTTLKDSYNEAMEHTEQFTEQIKWAEDTYNQITGAYNNALGILDDLKGVQQKLMNLPSGLQEQASKWAGMGEMEQSFDGVERLLSSTFPDVRDADSLEYFMLGNQQFQLKQLALKKAIQTSETTMGEVADDLETLARLSEKIDDTENIKDSLDLNNRFLAEIATILNKMLLAQAAYFEATTLLDYQGADDEAMQTSEELVQRQRAYDPLEGSKIRTDELNAAGIAIHSASDEDIAGMFKRK